MFNFTEFVSKLKGGRALETDTLYTTPWAWRREDGLYVGHNKSMWLYRVLDVHPMFWEDGDTKLELGSPLASALYDLASTSKDVGGIKALSKNREVHLLSLTWEEPARPAEGTPDGLYPFIRDAFDFTVTQRAVVIGVRLWSSSSEEREETVMDRLRGAITTSLGEGMPDFAAFEKDYRLVDETLKRYSISKPPARNITRQMEAWYADGEHADATLYEARDEILNDQGDRIEMAAVMSFDNPMLYAPDAMWAMDASNHPEGASVISIRGELETSAVARNRVRRAERKVLAQIEEEAATGDIERAENEQTLHLAQTVENLILNGNEPLFANCSILMGRRVGPGTTDYMDALEAAYGITMKPLEHRQMSALDETLPCSSKRVNPFVQDVSVSMLAYAGLQSYSNLGDSKGAFLGLVDPDYVPCYLDPLGAPAANLPPGMLLAGEPGSGKTFAAQSIAVQAAMAGHKSVFVNPKSDDSLEGLLDLVPGQVVNLTDIEEDGGYFDPFRFCEDSPEGRQIAAEILSQHILAVLGSRGVAGQGFTQEEEIAVIAGVRKGAEKGARCAAQAISCIEDSNVKELIAAQATDPLFRLGIGMVPQESYASTGDLLLIQFDKPLDIPEKGVSPAEYTRSQRLAVSAVRLVTRASMELLANANGGVIVIDEAWMYLQSSEGLAALQSFGRLGRSKNILPIFATQRVDDLLRTGVDMSSYLSRVLCLKLTDPAEATAALKLCGLQATQSRIDWLRDAGAKYSDDGQLLRGAVGLHRDLKDRHSAVMIGPVPEYAREAFSTNPEDRRRRRERKLRESGS